MPLLLGEPKPACEVRPGDFICVSPRISTRESDWSMVKRIVEIEGLPVLTLEFDGGRTMHAAPSARVDWCKEVFD